MREVENHKEMVPFEHYVALYAKLNPEEAALRCGVHYDPAARRFKMRLSMRETCTCVMPRSAAMLVCV